MSSFRSEVDAEIARLCNIPPRPCVVCDFHVVLDRSDKQLAGFFGRQYGEFYLHDGCDMPYCGFCDHTLEAHTGMCHEVIPSDEHEDAGVCPCVRFMRDTQSDSQFDGHCVDSLFGLVEHEMSQVPSLAGEGGAASDSGAAPEDQEVA